MNHDGFTYLKSLSMLLNQIKILELIKCVFQYQFIKQIVLNTFIHFSVEGLRPTPDFFTHMDTSFREITSTSKGPQTRPVLGTLNH